MCAIDPRNESHETADGKSAWRKLLINLAGVVLCLIPELVFGWFAASSLPEALNGSHPARMNLAFHLGVLFLFLLASAFAITNVFEAIMRLQRS